MLWLSRGIWRLAAYSVALIVLAPAGLCEQLPIRVYSIADGLAHNHVSRIRSDSRGFLWFCTDEGLSRWDGYQFKSYTTSDGLPHAHVDDFLETRRGEYWIATDGGLALFHPERKTALFSTYFPGSSSLSRAVNVLLEDRDGTVLLGTGDGLYRLQHTPTEVRIRPEDAGLAGRERDGALVNALLLTRDGKLWIGAGSGIYTRSSDGHWRRFCKSDRLPENFINQLREAPDGQIWAGIRGGGLAELTGEPDQSGSILTQLFTKADGLPSNDVRDFLISGNGHIWVGTTKGLAEAWLKGAGTKAHFRSYSIMEGLAEQSVYWFSENPIGDLWLATGRAGAIRLTSGGFQTYTGPDGFRPQEANQVMETRDGQLCVVNGDRSKRLTQCFNGDGFLQRNVLQRPDLQFGFERRQFALQDHLGQWWFATERGALRIPDLVRSAEAGQGEFIPTLPMSLGVWQLFEDSKKIIWMAEESAESNTVITWNPFTRTTNVVWRKSNSGANKKTMASCFLEHRTGQMWIGLSGEGGVLRWRGDHFDSFGRQDGVPSGEIAGLYQDHSNHVWLASTEGGLGKVDDPTADHPHIRTYTRANGLSSDEIWCITEDHAGRIYVGTGRGVDAVDPATNHVAHYTPDDGLVPGRVNACFCDRAGELWFVTDRGVSRFNPARQVPPDLPRTLITEFRIRGAASPVSQLGALHVGPVQLGPTQNQVTIDFLGMDSRLRGDLRYQYRLLGADTSWSKPMQERSITFASLAPRRYRFEVRGVDAHGGLSIPAVAAFSISPPVWQRWWFELLASLALLGLLYWLHHYRTLRLLELERVRMRIATDLHDDIGSSLSQIAVLSEVALQRRGSGEAAEPLERIGGLSRELLDSLGDVVWAIQPDKDHLSDLSQRMRRFAADVFSTGNVEMHWSATAPERDFELYSGTRREVYLIFKETIRNIVRHSRATEAWIALAVLDGYLSLEVSDNGRGIERFDSNDGNGLRNMELRAERLGGDLEVRTAAGKGTTVRLRAPLRMRAAGRQVAT